MKEQSILIVEDDGLIALHLQELLENAGYVVPDPVPSGEDAIECVNAFPHPDLILMYITLDGKLDGIETAREIQKRFDIPVIFLTAHSEANRVARMEGVASCGFLEKPFIQSKLISAVEKALGPVDMARFIQSYETGNGDYTGEHHQWLPDNIDEVKERPQAAEKN